MQRVSEHVMCNEENDPELITASENVTWKVAKSFLVGVLENRIYVF